MVGGQEDGQRELATHVAGRQEVSGGQADRQTDRQAGRQTDRQRRREGARERERESTFYRIKVI